MEDFVTFDIAKKLKEKGFREECLCHYVGDDLIYNIESPIANNQLWFSHNKYDNIWHKDNVDAPTISQVLKWLRNEKNIHIAILVIIDFSTDADNNICEEWSFWSFYVTNLNDGSTIYDDCQRIDSIEYQSYEESAIAGIEYVLDKLI